MTLTVWAKLSGNGMIIIDNQADMGHSEEGYHWQVNDSGYMIFMAGNDSSDQCGHSKTDCYVKSSD